MRSSKFIALISLGFLGFSGVDQLAVVPEQSGLMRLGSDINMKGYLDDKIWIFWRRSSRAILHQFRISSCLEFNQSLCNQTIQYLCILHYFKGGAGGPRYFFWNKICYYWIGRNKSSQYFSPTTINKGQQIDISLVKRFFVVFYDVY